MPIRATRPTTTPMAIWSPVLREMAVCVEPDAPAISGSSTSGLSSGKAEGSLPGSLLLFSGEEEAEAG